MVDELLSLILLNRSTVQNLLIVSLSPHDSGPGGLGKENCRAVVTKAETIGEEHSIHCHTSSVQDRVIVQQLTVPSPLKRLQNNVTTWKLLTRVREEHAPVVEDNQIICKVDKRDFPVVN